MTKKLNILLIFLIVLYKNIMYWPMITNGFLYMLIIIMGIVTFFACSKKTLQKKHLIFIITLSVLLAVAVFHSESANLLFPILILFSFYNEKDSYKQIAKNYFYSLLICFLLTIFLNKIGILPSYNITRYNIIRYSLGYIHPNFVFLYFFFICISGYYAFDNQKLFVLITLPFAILFYNFSLSRTGIACYYILIFLIFIYKNNNYHLLNKISKYLFYILTILTIIFVMLYNQNIFVQLDFLLSGRLANWSYFIKNGLLSSPIGKIHFSSTTYTIDNFFLVLFYDYGYVGYVIYSILNFISIKKNEADKKFLICMVSFLIYGLCDSNTIVTSINFLLPLQLIIIFNKNNKSGDDLIEES
ncbi:MAG: hypothetical protein PHE54_00805 [Bacilli bacterium]|nr:hypothetical protein [Bacilli bacterium]